MPRPPAVWTIRTFISLGTKTEPLAAEVRLRSALACCLSCPTACSFFSLHALTLHYLPHLASRLYPTQPQALASLYYSPRSLAAMCLAYLPLMGLSAALSIPGGLFMPSFLLGGSFGALSGLALRSLAPPGWRIQPGLYALCGATAVLGGVFRSSISIVVLITESCGEGASVRQQGGGPCKLTGMYGHARVCRLASTLASGLACTELIGDPMIAAQRSL